MELLQDGPGRVTPPSSYRAVCTGVLDASAVGHCGWIGRMDAHSGFYEERWRWFRGHDASDVDDVKLDESRGVLT